MVMVFDALLLIHQLLSLDGMMLSEQKYVENLQIYNFEEIIIVDIVYCFPTVGDFYPEDEDVEFAVLAEVVFDKILPIYDFFAFVADSEPGIFD
ncbi:MAG: hypothetical protein EZS28_028556 [Streblomastix strix]|uniref:Uncharacterized protein n=1 Tax=Streblomastix strix TaxID=222440 RepID=A0A5J4UYZ4_9EUKA|nr:MAG: hypothetical protein EZS28_028556 [Streblomastix strix]